MPERRLFSLAAAALLYASPAPAANQLPILLARPAVTQQQLPPGITSISGIAFAYRPNAVAAQAPLVLLLHPAGGDARRFIEETRPIADRLGFIILAPQSIGGTWDFAQTRHFGPDIDRIDAALRELFSRTAIDPHRIVVAGFSDGASYALSLGLANPRLFRGVVALSPGFLTENGPYGGERVFIAHGRDDRVLPITFVLEDLIPKLQSGHALVLFRSFAGGHEVDPAQFEAGLRYTLGRR